MTADSGDIHSGAPGTSRTARWMWHVALALPWLVCGGRLLGMWSYEVERYYGFVVFPLAGYLFFQRWENAPAASPPRRSGARLGWSLMVVVGAVTLGAGMLLLSASPLWTMAGWVALCGAAGFSAGLLGRAGGWRWVRDALAPMLFAFTALPWPAMLAVPTVRVLRGWNALCAAELVSQFGRPAVAHGATIETAGGWVGVETACSGLVALQTALMLAFFFGELRRLRIRDRVLLVAGAVGLALGINLARATWLVWQTAGGALTPDSSAHETAGLTELGVATVAVAAWSIFFGKSRGGGSGKSSQSRPDLAPGWTVCSVAAMAACLTAVAVWYRLPAAAGADRGVIWKVVRPDPGWRNAALSPGLRSQLRADQVDYISWRDATANRDWIVLHLRWSFDPAMRYGPGMHRPEICLPRSGAQLEVDLGVRTVRVSDVMIAFQWARFSANGQAFHTFSCLWDPGLGKAVDVESVAAIDIAQDRVARVREHRRQFGLERITIAVNQCRDDAEALSLVEAMVPRLLQRE